jgi:hypothetical protein
MKILNTNKLFASQRLEGWELLGFETRNKYQFMDENKEVIGFAAEQRSGIVGALMRNILGHWRKFEVTFFDNEQKSFMNAIHPFRFFFQRLEVYDVDKKIIGALQQRFSILSKKFDVLDSQNMLLFEMRSPIWKIWTFPFYKMEQEVAIVSKKWSGLLSEVFTDRDQFMIDFKNSSFSESERKLIIATSIFIDLQYFEKKASN